MSSQKCRSLPPRTCGRNCTGDRTAIVTVATSDSSYATWVVTSRRDGKAVLYRADKQASAAALADLQADLQNCC
jgi:hypothetical protein